MSQQVFGEYNSGAMIRKLAEELATNDLVLGTNEARPLDPPAAPPDKDSADKLQRYGAPERVDDTNNEDQAGVLSRVLDGYKDAVRSHQDSLADALGDHVRGVTGSSTLSRSAVQRNRNSNGG